LFFIILSIFLAIKLIGLKKGTHQTLNKD